MVRKVVGKTDQTTGLLMLAMPDMLAVAGDESMTSEKVIEFINESNDRALATKALNAFDKKSRMTATRCRLR